MKRNKRRDAGPVKFGKNTKMFSETRRRDMSSKRFDKELMLSVPMGTLEDLAAVALADYLRAIRVIDPSETDVVIKFGEWPIWPKHKHSQDQVPFVVKIYKPKPDILEKALKRNGTKR